MLARRFALAVALSLPLAACSSSTEPANQTATTSATTTTGTTTTTTTTTATSTATLGSLTVEELHTELAAKDFVLLNVHVPHDVDIPGTDAALTYEDVDAIAAYLGADLEKKVVVYCFGTSMSKPTGTTLAARGYTHVRYLLGGYGAWEKAGYDVTK